MSIFGNNQLDLGASFGDQTGGLDTAIRGAGFADMPAPDLNVTWDEIKNAEAYKSLGPFGIPNLGSANFSDSVIDWAKFGVNNDIPMIYPGQSPTPVLNEFGGETFGADGQQLFNYPATQWGNIRLDGSAIQRLVDGNWNTVDQWGHYDRDPTDIMGWADPRLNLIMSDATGWNDPLSNWLQSQGEHFAADTLGNLNYRARNGDSSHMFFDPQSYYVSRLGADAARVLGADPGAIASIQQQWNEGMSPGAQSARHDAMFGGGFFDDIMPMLAIAGLAFGLPALFSAPAAAGAGAATAGGLGASTAAAGLGTGTAMAGLGTGTSAIGMGLGLEGLGSLALTDIGLGAGLGLGFGEMAGLGSAGLFSAAEAATLFPGAFEGLSGLELGFAPVADASLVSVNPEGWMPGSIWEDAMSYMGSANNIAKDAMNNPWAKKAREAYGMYNKAEQALSDPRGDLRASVQQDFDQKLQDQRDQLQEQYSALESLGRRAPRWAGRNNFARGRI